MMKDLSKVITRPIVTERGTILREMHNQYYFQVNPDANKHEIRQAIEMYFGVKVENVRTMNRIGKIKRMGRFSGRRASWKKAIVTLAEGDSIDLFDNV
ncbi:MAG: 50S ribosomal protein L23 [bacterium]|nr:50S ribosomal protein L23 [bacterium]MCP4798591.1 50S ribosomal protein L23 [bacterium]